MGSLDLAESIDCLSLRLRPLFEVVRIDPLNIPSSVTESRYVALVSALINNFLLAVHYRGKDLAERHHISFCFPKRHTKLVLDGLRTLFEKNVHMEERKTNTRSVHVRRH